MKDASKKVEHSQVQRLKKEMKAQGFTIARLSEVSGKGTSTIKKMLGGVSSPSLKTYAEIASVLGIELVPQKRRRTA